MLAEGGSFILVGLVVLGGAVTVALTAFYGKDGWGQFSPLMYASILVVPTVGTFVMLAVDSLRERAYRAKLQSTGWADYDDAVRRLHQPTELGGLSQKYIRRRLRGI